LAAVQKATQIIEGFYHEKNPAVLPEITQRLEVAFTMLGKVRTSSINQVTTALLQKGSAQKNPDFLHMDEYKYDEYQNRRAATRRSTA
jgi:hypothetical protein